MIITSKQPYDKVVRYVFDDDKSYRDAAKVLFGYSVQKTGKYPAKVTDDQRCPIYRLDYICAEATRSNIVLTAGITRFFEEPRNCIELYGNEDSIDKFAKEFESAGQNGYRTLKVI